MIKGKNEMNIKRYKNNEVKGRKINNEKQEISNRNKYENEYVSQQKKYMESNDRTKMFMLKF